MRIRKRSMLAGGIALLLILATTFTNHDVPFLESVENVALCVAMALAVIAAGWLGGALALLIVAARSLSMFAGDGVREIEEILECAIVIAAVGIARDRWRRLREAGEKLRAVMTENVARAENRYRSIVERARDIIFTLLPDGTIISLNPAFEWLTGYRVEEWIDRHFIELVDEDHRHDALQRLAGAFTAAETPLVRSVIRARDGRSIVIEVSISTEFLDGGEVHLLGFARDVTERERADAALRRSERLLADSQRIARLGSWEHDLVRNELWWSNETYQLLGIEPCNGPVSFELFLEQIDDEQQTHLDRQNQILFDRGEHEWELRIRTPAGLEKILSCNGRVIRGDDGTALRIFGSSQDITERKKAEQLLRESDERFHLLGRASNDVMWDWNVVTGAVWWGEGLSETFGLEAPVEDGFAFWQSRIHPDDRDRVLRMVDEFVQSEQVSYKFEYRFCRADGTNAVILDRAHVVRDANGQALRMVGAMIDMTERNLMSEKLAQANRVSSLGRIAASIAHEFNNLLMSVQPNLEVIRARRHDDLNVPLTHVLNAVKRGKRITEEILRFTRPAEPTLQHVRVTELLSNWQHETQPLLGDRIDVVIEIREDLWITADPLQITQVLTNLALNARDAMQGSGCLSVTAERSDRFVHFRVSDTGSGMTADQLAHVFEPLFTTKRGGTGLGLAVTYQIVSRHDGRIHADSTPGHGTTFHVMLPAAQPAVKIEEKIIAPLPRDLRVLMVEDESAISTGLRALMELDDIESSAVETGGAAISAIERFSPHLVVLDIGLPDMSGVDVFMRIAERWPDLPVLFSSGHADPQNLDRFLSRPHVGLLAKPYDYPALLASIAELLEASALLEAGAA